MLLRLEAKVPELMAVERVVAMVAMEGSVLLAVVFTEGVMAVVTVVEPLNTPTTLTREVSTMLRSAQRLLIKLVMELLLLKKSSISMEK